MYSLISNLIIYRDVEKNSILYRLAEVFKKIDEMAKPADGSEASSIAKPADGSKAYSGTKSHDVGALRDSVLDEMHRLLDLATDFGFDKNLWQNYIAYLLAMTETPFTIVSEKKGHVEGSVNEFVKNDLRIFKKLLDYDFSHIEKVLGINCFSVITDYHSVEKKDRSYNKNVSLRIRELSEAIAKASDENEFYDVVMDFYGKYGVGQFGMNKAFRISPGVTAGINTGTALEGNVNGKGHTSDILVPIIATSDVVLDDLVGYEAQKRELVQNTEAFLSGKPANNVLLYGDAGTGKSTSIKALLNLYYEKGLRVIEIYRHEFKYLPEIISIIKGRNYRFIIYMDDLSFETGETEYKYLKAVIEGDLEARPDNVLIYATSNRRHLLKENFSDRDYDEDDIHHSDTVAERLSLSGRFGVTIAYFRPERQTYYDIVRALAKKREDLDISEEELLAEADKWALRHGGQSGRVAQQFVDHLTSNEN